MMGSSALWPSGVRPCITCSPALQEQHRYTRRLFTRLIRKMKEKTETKHIKWADGRTCGGGESAVPWIRTGKWARHLADSEKQSLWKDEWFQPSEIFPLKALSYTWTVPLAQVLLASSGQGHITHSGFILDLRQPGKSFWDGFGAAQPEKTAQAWSYLLSVYTTLWLSHLCVIPSRTVITLFQLDCNLVITKYWNRVLKKWFYVHFPLLSTAD